MPRGRPLGSKNKSSTNADTTAVRTLEKPEQERLEAELNSSQEMLKATSEFGTDGYKPAIPEGVEINKDKIKDRVNHLKTVLDRETPRKVTDGNERSKITAEMRRLESIFGPYLETWKDIGCMRPDTPEYKEAVKKALSRPKYEVFIQKWKELAKKLEPDDTDFCSLDRIRKDK